MDDSVDRCSMPKGLLECSNRTGLAVQTDSSQEPVTASFRTSFCWDSPRKVVKIISGSSATDSIGMSSSARQISLVTFLLSIDSELIV